MRLRAHGSRHSPQGSTARSDGRSAARARRRWWQRLALWLIGGALLLPPVVVAALRIVDPPLTPLMVIRHFEGETIIRHWRPLDAISPHLRRAVIAAEDNTFCRHRGFDWPALRSEIRAWRAGERPRGASTITMQTAKNVFLWPGRDPLRKGLEAWLTPQLEFLWGKQRILEVYLNVAEMGPGLYGAEAAALAHFGKSARGLSAREASLLAASLPNPRAVSPTRPSHDLARRAQRIDTRIGQLGPLLDCIGPP